MITVIIASRLREDRLGYLSAMHASLTRQSVPWEAIISLDGVSPDRLPAPLALDSRVRTLVLPRPVGAACARNLALPLVRTPYCNWADDDDEFTDDAMSVRLNTLESAGVGWCAGWSEDRYSDGTSRLWRCPTPPGRHEAGDVWTYWKSPADTIPIGPTTILARTDLVRAAPMGGLVQGEDYCTAVGISNLAPGILLPTPVYRYRKHAGQLTAQPGYDLLETAAREHAWQYGRSLRSLLRDHQPTPALSVRPPELAAGPPARARL
ncbi:glycosyltransferase [Streptomyces sp. H27-C3]|uniref:glycosyltransferase n=1 Tax=Streptomyces sp. H27-C3 TaxID=3046305 RepID=UPI0024B8A839|nr:glycosyltransferase [Streptomyces sp. H27-C3]MDJ0464694.1 glycosyltransferase [Streptomyces sp. H27-C3]